MKYFRNTASGEVLAYEQDGSQDHLITPDLVPMAAAEIELHINPARQPTTDDVDVERDRRLVAGLEFRGKVFQTRPNDYENINGAAQLASMAVAGGTAESGNLRWLEGDRDFTWIAADNSLVAMDAPTFLAFCRLAMARKQSLIFAGRQLKDMEAIPSDYVDDKWWP
ncbi:DUF4376 domain-containing protein [Pseudomonas sp. PDM13]|uniref:DUF4376 domain-containing protein n=1 Tax=Pseudomonas sp. PDM13 TaxID=2769255 RepID=UPI0021E030FA|nr:DUF4376 domain-containing protein [Pseudomonas sp. PDM13]MCU9946877.1 DUF4376 domain-containing protein [Pseudomonas sp. PDM13]